AQDSEIMRLLRVVREREAQQKVVDEANRSLATDISEPEYSNHPILPLTGTDLEQLTDSNSVLRGTAQNIASFALRNKQGNVANITPFLLSFTSAIQSEVMKLNRRASSAALQEGLGEIHQKAETLSLLLQRAQAASRAALLPQNDSPGTATEADVFSAVLSHAKGDFPPLETFLDLARSRHGPFGVDYTLHGQPNQIGLAAQRSSPSGRTDLNRDRATEQPAYGQQSFRQPSSDPLFPILDRSAPPQRPIFPTQAANGPSPHSRGSTSTTTFLQPSGPCCQLPGGGSVGWVYLTNTNKRPFPFSSSAGSSSKKGKPCPACIGRTLEYRFRRKLGVLSDLGINAQLHSAPKLTDSLWKGSFQLLPSRIALTKLSLGAWDAPHEPTDPIPPILQHPVEVSSLPAKAEPTRSYDIQRLQPLSIDLSALDSEADSIHIDSVLSALPVLPKLTHVELAIKRKRYCVVLTPAINSFFTTFLSKLKAESDSGSDSERHAFLSNLQSAHPTLSDVEMSTENVEAALDALLKTGPERNHRPSVDFMHLARYLPYEKKHAQVVLDADAL
ncbi:hypothetical protein PQX77_002987, partial [Marasmius sp. AFHP31]